MLRVDIASLKPGLHHLALTPKAVDLDLDPMVFRDIEVKVQLDHGGRRILVQVNATATATLTCDRTLVPFDQQVSGPYTVLFAPPEMVGAEDDTAEDIQPLASSDSFIDLTEAVRDTLMLALPVRRVAPGAEEVALPTSFGDDPDEEDRIDPRWAALKGLQTPDADAS